MFPGFKPNFDSWRSVAKKLILQRVKPQEISWQDKSQSLFSLLDETDKSVAKVIPINNNLTVPKDYIGLARTLSYARDEHRWDLMYRILYRIKYENRNLLSIHIDNDIRRAQLIKKSIGRDIHKMHAFVRFKKLQREGKEYYVAWHQPEHIIFKPASSFFARRFGDKPWSIYTPDGSAHWNLKKIHFDKGISYEQFNTYDEMDELWKTYYTSIFNPARIKVKMMKSEMYPKYWKSMPETDLIDELIRSAPLTLQQMADNHNKAAKVSKNWDLKQLKTEASHCTACPLFATSKQCVFGSGPAKAKIMIVGEQPGSAEDDTGLPFQGPAGKILRKSLV